MGEAYRHVTQELEERNLHIPSPLLAPEASPHTSDKDSSPSGSSDIETSSWDTALNRSGNKSEFVRGLDFLHLDLPMVPKLDSFAFRSKTEDLQQTKKDEDMSMTVRLGFICSLYPHLIEHPLFLPLCTPLQLDPGAQLSSCGYLHSTKYHMSSQPSSISTWEL